MKKHLYIMNFTKFLLHKIYIVMVVVAFAMVLGLAYFSKNPRIVRYQAETKLAIDAEYEIVMSYAEIGMSNITLERIAAQLGGDYTKDDLKSSLVISTLPNTKIVKIQSIYPDKKKSEEIVAASANITLQKFKEIFGVQDKAIKQFDGVYSYAKESGIGKKVLAFFAVGGCGLGMAIVWFMYDTDVNKNNPKKHKNSHA